MSNVFVIDTHSRPVNPVHPGRARILLQEGKASVYRMYPFTIVLKKEVKTTPVPPLRVKLDPGSKTTGMAIVNDTSGEVVFAAELTHRGQAIKASLDDRRAVRRSRRKRKTRYRKARWQNRKRKPGMAFRNSTNNGRGHIWGIEPAMSSKRSPPRAHFKAGLLFGTVPAFVLGREIFIPNTCTVCTV